MTKRLRKMSLQWPHDIVRLLNKEMYPMSYLAFEGD